MKVTTVVAKGGIATPRQLRSGAEMATQVETEIKMMGTTVDTSPEETENKMTSATVDTKKADKKTFESLSKELKELVIEKVQIT